MSRDLIIRQLQESDADKIHSIALEAWQFTYQNIFEQTFIEEYVNRNYSKESIISLLPEIQSGSVLFEVAECESRIVGFCNLGFNNNEAALYRIYLLPAFIGQGIGKKMLEHCEAFVKEHGAASYSCYVHKDNEIGVQFYVKSGFKHITGKDKGDKWYMEKII